jgi:hypothetical protein
MHGRKQPMWLIVGVGVLAAVTISLVTFAVTSQPGPRFATRAPVDPVPSPDAEPELNPAPLEPVRALFRESGPLTISVLGDGTSGGYGGWVALWAQDLAETRTVTLHMWDAEASSYDGPVTYGTTGDPVEIWNYSVPGAVPDAPASGLPAAQPERPDLVVYNFGHTSSPGAVGNELDTTVRAVRRLWDSPVRSLLILQNPARHESRIEQSETIYYLRTFWARASRTPTINVFAAFRYAPGPVTRLLADDQVPNEQGSRLWANVVSAALRTS